MTSFKEFLATAESMLKIIYYHLGIKVTEVNELVMIAIISIGFFLFIIGT